MLKISCLDKNAGKSVQDGSSSQNRWGNEITRFDNEKMVGETRFYEELSIAYKFMSYVGLFFLDNTSERNVNPKKMRKQKVYLLYQWFLDVLIVINTLRFFDFYRHLKNMGPILVALVYHTFMVLTALLSCMRPYLGKHISLFIIRIFSHKFNNRNESSVNRLANFTRFYVIFICAYGFLSSIGFNLVAPSFYPGPVVFHTYPFTKSSCLFYPILVVFGIASTLSALRVYVILAHCFAMCHFLTLEYMHLAQTIRSRITAIYEDGGHFLETHRKKFEALNGLLKHVNKISNLSLMLVILFCLFELCMMIYGLLQYIENIDFYSISFSAAFGTLFTALITGAGIILSSSMVTVSLTSAVVGTITVFPCMNS